MNVLPQVLLGEAPFAKPAHIMTGIPFELAKVRPAGLPHSLYEELWHLNYWLHFSLALIRGEERALPEHSSDAFPTDNESLSATAWKALLEQMAKGLDDAAEMAKDTTELARKCRPDRTVAEELIVVAAHNAYHFGRMVSIRQALGIWTSELGDRW